MREAKWIFCQTFTQHLWCQSGQQKRGIGASGELAGAADLCGPPGRRAEVLRAPQAAGLRLPEGRASERGTDSASGKAAREGCGKRRGGVRSTWTVKKGEFRKAYVVRYNHLVRIAVDGF